MNDFYDNWEKNFDQTPGSTVGQKAFGAIMYTACVFIVLAGIVFGVMGLVK